MSKVPTLEELMKQGLILKGNDERLTIRRLPLGIPQLDTMLGGGLPYGRTTLAYGPESTGKTLMAQYAVAAQQKQKERPLALLMDMERSYDRGWWAESGVDTENLLVSDPATAEDAIDIMRRMVDAEPRLGIIVLDSIAAMTPMPEADLENSSENKTIGLLARAVTLMFRQLNTLSRKQIIFFVTNQMRETIGAHDELQGLPGGRSQRHFASIILKTRREGWITDDKSKQRVGFTMELSIRKNKVAPVMPPITIPFRFNGQLDLLTSFIDDALSRGLILQKGAWYYVREGVSFMGRAALRQFFADSAEERAALEASVL